MHQRLIAELEAEDRGRVLPGIRDPQLLEHLVMGGPTNAATGMRLAALKKRYPASYARLKANKMGQESFYGRGSNQLGS